MSNLFVVNSKSQRNLIWVSSLLAFLTAIAYLLIATGLMSIGDANSTAGEGSIIFVAAGCYFVGGLMIHLKRHWLWIIGFAINFLVVTFYFSMYAARPEILLSDGGLTTKFYQVLLEAALLALIICSWIQDRRQTKKEEEKLCHAPNDHLDLQLNLNDIRSRD